MYLSRLLLNPRARQVQREIANPYELHRSVMTAFAAELPDKERVLHRLDTNPRTGQVLLLVQSHTEPDWTHLAGKNYLLPADPFNGLDNPAVKPVNLALQAGQQLRFRLRANPTKRLLHDVPVHDAKKGQRVGLYSEQEQLDWLLRKAEKNGFKVLEVNLINEGTATGQTKDRHRLNLLAVRFEGLLQVIAPDKFLEAIQTGLGPAKAFGCGLLSLARV